MATTGRNDPCHCGSGKKYKRCCLTKDEAAAAAQRPRPDPEEARPQPRSLRAFFDDFDDQAFATESNHVVDLLDAGRLDEAEAAAQKLLRDYPDMIDGLDRLGMVYEARGDKVLAATYYRKALDFMTSNEGFDDEGRAAMRQRIERLAPNLAQ